MPSKQEPRPEPTPEPTPEPKREPREYPDRAELHRRITHIFTLLRDGNNKREAKAFLEGNNAWARSISKQTWERYFGRAYRWLEQAGQKTRAVQLGKSITRYENWIRKALAQSPPNLGEARKLQTRLDRILGLEQPLRVVGQVQHTGTVQHEHKHTRTATHEERVTKIRELVAKAFADQQAQQAARQQSAQRSARNN